MKDKFKDACVKYEFARAEIIRLSKEIGDSVGVYDENMNYQASCSSHGGGFIDADTCLERLYKWRNEYSTYLIVSEEFDSPVDAKKPEGEEPCLCAGCAKTDDLIQQRKYAKKLFGIAKRRITAVAKSIGEI